MVIGLVETCSVEIIMTNKDCISRYTQCYLCESVYTAGWIASNSVRAAPVSATVTSKHNTTD